MNVKLDRNEAIRIAVEDGEEPNIVAARFGISRQRVNQILHRNRYNSRQKLHSSKNRGVVTPPEYCSMCGLKTGLEAHHPDYSKPLEVVWVCHECHNSLPRSNQQYGLGPRKATLEKYSRVCPTCGIAFVKRSNPIQTPKYCSSRCLRDSKSCWKGLPEGQKRCTDCGEVYSIDDGFYRGHNHCKQCVRSRFKKQYRSNKE